MKIALLGYGRMGQAIEKFALQRAHQIVFTLDKDSAQGDLSKADVAINFSVPQSAVANIKSALEKQIPVVSGTTGWLDDYEEVAAFCKAQNTGFLYASNFSIGVNLFFKINTLVAKLMKSHQEDYQPSLEEIHHIHKLDAPSGTALSLADSVLNESSFKEWELDGNSKTKLNIHSKREGEVPGTHTVKYTSSIDEISLKHEAFGRDGFALGAIIAAEWLMGKKGVFGMKDVLNIS
ncbi:MAG: 4-hydroxy-tetrahydrodipicolinate reductase [Flavobacteriaceae bacterium]|jgi:4-hydroxy-tetrahydrodipicolinate reductase|nr:4-hydroxy-tetrahydrodipicolinate reductase [Flavobacteriaceae bacterium]MDG2386492.1 4-hydroxy-tetrahydrodipicolinate reductase [Flavobacteriaceae bacterium]